MPTLSPRMQRILMYYALVKLLTEPRGLQRISAGGGGIPIGSLAQLGVKDHDLLDGLSDDDHTQYLLIDGTRDFTGNQNVESLVPVTHLGSNLGDAGHWFNLINVLAVYKVGTIQGQPAICVFKTPDIVTRKWVFASYDGAAQVVCATLLGGEMSLDRAGDIDMLDGKFHIFDKASGNGIKVDTTTPTFGWRDLLGPIRTRGVGATDPGDATYNGNIKAYQFAVNDECWNDFHIPHDYVIGTDIHLHFHWSHIGTLVTGGNVTWGADITYAKGHDQAPFPASVNTTVVGNASTTQYQHMITEVKISDSTPGASEIDTDNLEPDGVIMIRAYLSANNITVSGGAVPDPFLHFVDVHYQTTNIGTKAKVPDFYT